MRRLQPFPRKWFWLFCRPLATPPRCALVVVQAQVGSEDERIVFFFDYGVCQSRRGSPLLSICLESGCASARMPSTKARVSFASAASDKAATFLVSFATSRGHLCEQECFGWFRTVDPDVLPPDSKLRSTRLAMCTRGGSRLRLAQKGFGTLWLFLLFGSLTCPVSRGHRAIWPKVLAIWTTVRVAPLECSCLSASRLDVP